MFAHLYKANPGGYAVTLWSNDNSNYSVHDYIEFDTEPQRDKFMAQFHADIERKAFPLEPYLIDGKIQ